jgi:hypothetical protein
MAVLLGVRTGIHPEGFILKDEPCPYEIQSLNNKFFNTPYKRSRLGFISFIGSRDVEKMLTQKVSVPTRGENNGIYA